MQLPAPVREAIEARAESLGYAALKRAAAMLSTAYREGHSLRLADEALAAAYLVTRMPATYAAAYSVLQEVRSRLGPVASILDAGSGTGAAALAARTWFPEAEITMIEREPALAAASREWLPDAKLLLGDFTAAGVERDLVIAAYSLGESGGSAQAAALWKLACRALIVIEPGTPRGFRVVRAVRDQLLGAGAHMIAPCPAEGPCPVIAPEWCHFAARIERSSLHRRVKEGERGYEDEKFCYVALARHPAPRAPNRIIRHPLHYPGLIVLETCTPGGLRTQRIARRDREAFRAARRAHWGGTGPLSPDVENGGI
jgi:ribosomal protein RSM22 (predicted rRNA methylase)